MRNCQTVQCKLYNGKQTNNTKKVNENDREIGGRINQGINFAKTAKETINLHARLSPTLQITLFTGYPLSPPIGAPRSRIHK